MIQPDDSLHRPAGADWATWPNLVTTVRLLLVAPIVVLLLDGERPVLTLVLLVLFGGSDWVDGQLARRLGQTSRVGAVLDPIADRTGLVVIVGALVVAGHLPLWIIVTIATVDLCLAAAYLVQRGRGQLGRQGPAVSVLGKVRTAVVMAGLALVALGLVPELATVAAVGQMVTGVGALLHLAAGVGYLRDLLSAPSPPTRTKQPSGRAVTGQPRSRPATDRRHGAAHRPTQHRPRTPGW